MFGEQGTVRMLQNVLKVINEIFPSMIYCRYSKHNDLRKVAEKSGAARRVFQFLFESSTGEARCASLCKKWVTNSSEGLNALPEFKFETPAHGPGCLILFISKVTDDVSLVCKST